MARNKGFLWLRRGARPPAWSQVGFLCCFAWLCCVLSACSAPPPADRAGGDPQGPEDKTELPLVLAQETPTSPGAVHVLEHHFENRDLILLRVEQKGADVVIRHLDPSGRLQLVIDSPQGAHGMEELWSYAASAGVHRFEISVFPGSESGSFIATLEPPRTVDAEERRLIQAEQLVRSIQNHLLPTQEDPVISTLTVDSLRRAAEIFAEAGLRERQARATAILCRALRYRQAPGVEPAVACRQAAVLFRSLEMPLEEAVNLSHYADALLDLGRAEDAVPPLQQAWNLFSGLGQSREVANAARQLADVYRSLGQLERALVWVDQAWGMKQHLDAKADAALRVSQGAVLLDMNRPLEAGHHFAAAEALYRQLKDDNSAAQASLGLARADFRSGQAQASVDRLIPMTELPFFALDSPAGRRRGSSLRIQLGRGLSAIEDVDRARQFLEQARSAAESVSSFQTLGTAHLELSRLDLKSGRAKVALKRLNDAQLAFEESGHDIGLRLVRLHRAHALRILGRFHEAWVHLLPALEGVRRNRVASSRVELRAAYFAYRQEFFDLAIELQMDLWQEGSAPQSAMTALSLHDHRRSRALIDVMAADRRRVETFDRLDTSHHELLEGLEEGEPSEMGPLLWQVLRREIHQTATPDDGSSESPAAEDLLRRVGLLDEGSLSLFYHLGKSGEDGQAFLWAIRGGRLQAFDLGPSRIVERAALDFRREVQTLSPGRQKQRRRSAERLSGLLFPEELSRGDARWLIFPSGALHGVPFAALHRPGDAAELIRHRELVVLPSIETLELLRRERCSEEGTAEGLAVFGDPVFSLDDSRLQRASAPGIQAQTTTDDRQSTETITISGGKRRGLLRRFGSDALQRLPASGLEARTAISAVPWRNRFVALGFDAHRQAFLDLSGRRFRILHLATHAFQDPQLPELSGLGLSRYDAEGQPRLGYLASFEIERLSLPVDLVVLSACRTALGPDVAAEGALGLHRAFFAAGARRVISSLWDVDDGSTARLMADFYRFHLIDELPASAALRSAQLARLNDSETAEPFHWAGFVFHGDWLPLDCGSRIERSVLR